MTQNNAAGLLDALKAKLGLKNDAALANALEIAPPVVSKIRSHRLPFGPTLILRMVENNIMTLPEIRAFVPRDV